MESDALPERIHSEVEEDMRGVPHAYLDSTDDSLQAVYSSLKKKFILKRWLGTVNIKVIKQSKGHHTSANWTRRIQITGLESAGVDEIQTLIRDEAFDVAMNALQLEDGSWGVEIL